MRLPCRVYVIAAISSFLIASAALAAPPAHTGLGTSWPNTADVGTSPRYHVYRFERSGVIYVQVNDMAGTVRGAIGYFGGQIIDLPIGVDATHWTINAQDLTSPPGEPVYHDDSVSISIAPQSDGTARMMVKGNCEEDPLGCSNHGP